jgi:hypothetical protein
LNFVWILSSIWAMYWPVCFSFIKLHARTHDLRTLETGSIQWQVTPRYELPAALHASAVVATYLYLLSVLKDKEGVCLLHILMYGVHQGTMYFRFMRNRKMVQRERLRLLSSLSVTL